MNIMRLFRSAFFLKQAYLGGLAPLDVLFAEAKVCDLDVTILVQQQVLQLHKN